MSEIRRSAAAILAVLVIIGLIVWAGPGDQQTANNPTTRTKD
jgi:hypothetical protein